jgi:hypothetical protein
MRTDDLIGALAQDAASRGPGPRAALALAAGAGLALTVTTLALTLGFRPDLAASFGRPVFLFKLAIVAALAAAAFALLDALARPGARADRRWLWAPATVFAVALVYEAATAPASSLAARAIGINGLVCLVVVPALAAAPLAVTTFVLRAAAPPSATAAGAVAGLLAGALGAFAYALYCPDDSPLFLAIWYVGALFFTSAAGAFVGRRALAW